MKTVNTLPSSWSANPPDVATSSALGVRLAPRAGDPRQLLGLLRFSYCCSHLPAAQVGPARPSTHLCVSRTLWTWGLEEQEAGCSVLSVLLAKMRQLDLPGVEEGLFKYVF